MRTFVMVMALLHGGWLLFDGTRALVAGDYVTAASGPRAGQLGPWARVVSAVGLDPRSAGVKWLHVMLGALWLTTFALLATRTAAARPCLLAAAVATLWYAPAGIVVGLVSIVWLAVG
jgi:hypothetical protein